MEHLFVHMEKSGFEIQRRVECAQSVQYAILPSIDFEVKRSSTRRITYGKWRGGMCTCMALAV